MFHAQRNRMHSDKTIELFNGVASTDAEIPCIEPRSIYKYLQVADKTRPPLTRFKLHEPRQF